MGTLMSVTDLCPQDEALLLQLRLLGCLPFLALDAHTLI